MQFGFQVDREEDLMVDCGEDIFPLNAQIEEDPLTAIARVYVPDGFVVATDGRELDHRTKSFRDDLQKIFHLHHQSGEIICSIAGYVRWDNYDTGAHFDTGAQVVKVAGDISSTTVRNPDDYASLFKDGLLKAVANITYPLTRAHMREETIIFLDGYLFGDPMRRKITLIHERNRTEAKLEAESLLPGKLLGRGSSAVFNALFGESVVDPLYSYRRICRQLSTNSTMQEASRICETFINAHCDPAALILDREHCEGVGGPIHIATVTRDVGFSDYRA